MLVSILLFLFPEAGTCNLCITTILDHILVDFNQNMFGSMQNIKDYPVYFFCENELICDEHQPEIHYFPLSALKRF